MGQGISLMFQHSITNITLSCFVVLLAACSAPVTPNVMMIPGSNDFFAMPWPNDTRLKQDGTLDLKHFPLLSNPVGYLLATSGAQYTEGFGTNTAVYFRTTVAIDNKTLPSIKESVMANSTVMLINIDEASINYGNPVPVRIDFQTKGTKYRPNNILALLPLEGFSLESNTTYAALLFKGIQTSDGNRLPPAPLLAELDKPWQGDSHLSKLQFENLKQQKLKVVNYLTDKTNRRPDELIAFTVYTTQNSTQDAIAILHATDELTPNANSLAVTDLHVIKSCQCESDHCADQHKAEIKGRYRMPQWQHGPYPYLFTGGQFNFDRNRKPILHHWKEKEFYLLVPCKTAPSLGFAASIRADESGAPLNSALDVWNFYAKANLQDEFNQIVISTEPYISSDPEVQPLLGQMQRILNFIGLDINKLALQTFIVFGANSVATRNNLIQEASDLLVLKKVLLNLASVMANNIALAQSAGAAPENFAVNAAKLGYVGQSQGSGSGILLMAYDNSFDFAQLNGTPTISYPSVLANKKLRQALEFFIYDLTPDELDIYHPVLQLIQTFTEPSNGLNYVANFNVNPLLMTHGSKDACVAKESAEAFAIALARKGLLSTIEGSTIDWVIEWLGRETVTLPYRLNRSQGQTQAILLETPIGHFSEGVEHIVGKYLYEMGLETIDETVEIDAPLIPDEFGNC